VLQEEYNFYEADASVHASSQLCRTLRMLRLRMADQLNHLVHRSVQAWLQFVATYASPARVKPLRDRQPFGQAPPPVEEEAEEEVEEEVKVEVKAPVESEEAEGEDGLPPSFDESEPEPVEEEPENPAKPAPLILLDEEDLAMGRVGPSSPLFEVNLVVRDGTVRFEPRVANLEKAVLQAVDDMVDAVRSLTDLSHEVRACGFITHTYCMYTCAAFRRLFFFNTFLP
jgi:hypothetical protein